MGHNHTSRLSKFAVGASNRIQKFSNTVSRVGKFAKATKDGLHAGHEAYKAAQHHGKELSGHARTIQTTFRAI